MEAPLSQAERGKSSKLKDTTPPGQPPVAGGVARKPPSSRITRVANETRLTGGLLGGSGRVVAQLDCREINRRARRLARDEPDQHRHPLLSPPRGARAGG